MNIKNIFVNLSNVYLKCRYHFGHYSELLLGQTPTMPLYECKMKLLSICLLFNLRHSAYMQREQAKRCQRQYRHYTRNIFWISDIRRLARWKNRFHSNVCQLKSNWRAIIWITGFEYILSSKILISLKNFYSPASRFFYFKQMNCVNRSTQLSIRDSAELFRNFGPVVVICVMYLVFLYKMLSLISC